MASRLFFRLLSLAVALLLLPNLALAGGSLPAQRAAVHPLVWEKLESDGEAEVLVVLRAQADLGGAHSLPTKEEKGRYVYETLRAVAEKTQRSLRNSLDAQGVDYQSFFIVNAVLMKAGNARVRALAARPDVARIVPNPWVQGVPSAGPGIGPLAGSLSASDGWQGAGMAGQAGGAFAAPLAPAGVVDVQDIEPNLVRVHADQVWALGYVGQGIVVAGQDTGYDWSHPALISQYRGWDGTAADHDYNWHDAIHGDNSHTAPGNPCGYDSPAPCDDDGHGTHTMGTMVGDDGWTNRIGMAPGARWIGCRNMEQGWGTPATYMECFEFFLAPYPVGGTPADGKPALAPHVVDNSWSCTQPEGCDPDVLEASVLALESAGIVVVVSAGNTGSACGTIDDPPAIYRESFTVGNFDHRTDRIASNSSRGPVSYGGSTYKKPDIAAPGVSVRSSVPDGGYGSSSGTSMAAPHVAGAVALLLSAAPEYAGGVGVIKQVLTSTAQPMTTSQGCGGDGPNSVPNNVWGWGILDAYAAVSSVTAGTLRGMVTHAQNGSPLAGANVTAALLESSVELEGSTDPSGSYTLTLAMGDYDVTVEASGFFSQTAVGIPVTETTVLDFALLPLSAPTAQFEHNGPICLGEPLILTNTSTLASRWSWAFGDGTVSDEWEPEHTYATADRFSITLSVTNVVGYDSWRDVVVVNPLPAAAFHWAADDLTVTFVNDSRGADAFVWSFGDGVTSTSPAPTHTYAVPGTYPVTLVASSECGQDQYAALVQPTAPMGLLRGRITDGLNGEPVIGSTATALPTSPSGTGSQATVNPSGYYTMTLPAGSYYVVARAEGYKPKIVTDIMVVHNEVLTLDFALAPLRYLYLPLQLKGS